MYMMHIKADLWTNLWKAMLPTDWIIREKSLATIGLTPRAENKVKCYLKLQKSKLIKWKYLQKSYGDSFFTLISFKVTDINFSF